MPIGAPNPARSFLREQILQQLGSKGERLDHDLAAALSTPLQMVRNSLAELASRGEVVLCQSIQFRDGERIEGLRCRVAASFALAAPMPRPCLPRVRWRGKSLPGCVVRSLQA